MVLDHLSGFARVACNRIKSAAEVGIKLVHILSTAIMPEILQSDNGNKFLGDCIDIITKFYGYIHIVKGRANHPELQGKIECGHSTFKEALQKWMEQHGDNWIIGASIVNHTVNKHSQFSRGEKFSPYNFYYGKGPLDNKNIVFGEVAQQCCKSEYGMMAGQVFSMKCQKVSKNHLIMKEELEYVMKKGGELFELVTNEEIQIAFADDLRQHIKVIVKDALLKFNLYDRHQQRAEDDMDGIESEFEEQQDLDDNKTSSASDTSDNNNSTIDEEKQLINDVEDNDI